MADTRTHTNRSVSQSVKTSTTKRRPKIVASDKVKTTGRKASVVRSTSTTTRRGNSIRSTGR